MYPVGFQEVDQEHDAAAGPGDGIGPGDRFQPVHEVQGDGDIADPDQAPADQHSDHGHRGLARAPHDARDAMGEGQQAIEQADGPHMPHAKIDDFGGIVKNPDQLGCEQVGTDTDQLRHNAGAGDAEAHTLLYPVVFAGTQVLAHEGGKGLAEAGDGQEGEAFQLGIGAAACHSRRAETVDAALNHQIRHGDDGILDTGGQAEADDIFQAGQIKADLPDVHLVGRVFCPQQVDAAEGGTDTLGDGSRHGSGAHTPLKAAHKQQVQHNIHASGEYQIIQGMTAVAHSVEDTHEDIVHHREDGTAEIVAEIADGLGQHLLGGAHPAQDRGGKGHTRNGQQHAGGEAEGDIRMYGLTHSCIVLRAIVPGDDHARAHGDAVEKAHHHKNQAAGGADRRQGGIPQEPAHHPGIEGIVELLEHIAQKHRQGEQQHGLPDGAFRQRIVFLHGDTLP